MTWLDAFLCTEPADRSAAEEAFAEAYAAIGKPKPGVIWFRSPLAAQRFVNRSCHRASPRFGARAVPRRPESLRLLMVDQLSWVFDLEGDQWREQPADLAIRHVAQVRDAVQAGGSAGDRGLEPLLGQHDAELLARVPWRRDASPLVRAMHKASKCCGWWWPLERSVVASEPTSTAHVDDQNRIHCETGPALVWNWNKTRDRFAVYAWHGTQVPDQVIMTPANQITVDKVDVTWNAELRRVLIERMGYDRYMTEGKAELLHEDDAGKLWRRRNQQRAPAAGWTITDPGAAIIVVEVINSTPEPDGTRRRYWLRVPPEMRRARQAVAWTFGLDEEDYAPLRET